MKTKTLPCLVRDPSGRTEVILNREGGSFGYPIWVCGDMPCPKRHGGPPLGDLHVRFGTPDQIHGIIWCEGFGKAERK